MRTHFPYVLNEEELALMRQYAQERLDLAKKEGRQDYLGKDDATSHFKGVCGEYVVSKWLGIPYEFTNGTYRTKPDIRYKGNKLEIRCGRELKVKRTDEDDQIVVNVIRNSDTEYEVSGWVYAHEGKAKKYEQDYGNKGRPAYFLPEGSTRTLESFLTTFAAPKAMAAAAGAVSPPVEESVFADIPVARPKKVVEVVPEPVVAAVRPTLEIPNDGIPTYELTDLDEPNSIRLRSMMGDGPHTIRVIYRGRINYLKNKAKTTVPEEYVVAVHGISKVPKP